MEDCVQLDRQVAVDTKRVLEVHDLRTHFQTDDGVVKAVDGISFTVRRGETLGIVGESGSGKSVACLSALRLVPTPPAVHPSGQVHFGGRDLLSLPERELEQLRGNRLAMIFQDPLTALNPYLSVARQLTEVLEVHQGATPAAARQAAIEMLTIQAQILDLIRELQAALGTAVVLITHDLGVVAGTADRVAVMYAGRIVEEGTTDEVFANPLHPYTRGLLASMPRIDTPLQERLTAIPGLPPDLGHLPSGCPFHPRCSLAADRCRREYPEVVTASATHHAVCWEGV